MSKGLPDDFSRDLWLDPLSFEGLIGRVLASSRAEYRNLFRPCGFAKSISELRQDKAIAALLPPTE